MRACIQALGCKPIYHRQLSQPRSLGEAPAPARARPSASASEANALPRRSARSARSNHRSSWPKAAVAALKAAAASPLPSTGVKHGTHSHRSVSSTTNKMGPVLAQEQFVTCQAPSRHPGLSSLTPQWRNNRRSREHRGQIDRPRHSRRSGAATDPRGTRAWPVDRVGAVGALRDWATDLATMSFGGGKFASSQLQGLMAEMHEK